MTEERKIGKMVSLNDVLKELKKGPEHCIQAVRDLRQDCETLFKSIGDLYSENVIINNFCKVKIKMTFEAFGEKQFEAVIGTSCKSEDGEEFNGISDVLAQLMGYSSVEDAIDKIKKEEHDKT